MTLIIRNALLPAPPEDREQLHIHLRTDGPQGKLSVRIGALEEASLSSIVIDDGKITALADNAVIVPGDVQELDASGLLVTPGWIDIQINGGFGFDFTEQPEAIWEVGAHLPALGLTAFLPTLISAPLEKLERAIAVFQAGPPPGWKGALALGLHLEGPFLNPAKKGAHNPLYLRNPDETLAENWTRSRGIWLVTLAPELPGALDLIRLLRENGVVVSAGHTQATYEQALQSFDAGITCATHLFNAQPALGQREPGLVGAVLDSPSVFAGIIADGVHVHPGLVRVAWRCKGSNLILVTDAVSALGMPAGSYFVGDYQVSVDETSVRLGDGTLAGSNATPGRCIRNLGAWTDLSAAEASSAMSSAPAELLGLGSKGRLVPGADADLTLITPEGKVAATLVGGDLLHDGREPSK